MIAEYEDLVLKQIIPAVPDFKWGHATDASKDDDGYSIVTVTVRSADHSQIPFYLKGCSKNVATELKRILTGHT